jgi:hypothetical protein
MYADVGSEHANIPSGYIRKDISWLTGKESVSEYVRCYIESVLRPHAIGRVSWGILFPLFLIDRKGHSSEAYNNISTVLKAYRLDFSASVTFILYLKDH